ncbi:hypothetical protein [Engelhardtia mirabilis]|uniref:DUF3299 domain-containing protein n=1 Tax=Engelhardtia mirabilis TaxID=2528011 RepID=A0A518BG47_9BACT|nr:hypothetical protein Pla133_10140 [Planctomycetes bacterium Pla133]QDV00274.1 hypothetical protein Pla86_10130 [Planctomycetes bacterium Pla86]
MKNTRALSLAGAVTLVAALNLSGGTALAVPGASDPLRADLTLDQVCALEEVTEVDIMTLTSIEWEPGADLPASITDLSGKLVLIRGYMHMSITEETSRFPFVSDACQCVGRLMPHHFIDVSLGEDTTEPKPGQFEILGRFNVGERTDEDGFVTSLYRIRGRVF